MNGSTSSQQRAKHWCFTVNNYTDEDMQQFEDLKESSNYWVYGKEVGDSGTSHLQCYIAFKKAKSLKFLKQNWPRGHFEIMLSNDPKRAADYCKKGIQSKWNWEEFGPESPMFGLSANFKEYGTIPDKQGDAGGRATKRKWEEIKDNAQKGDLDKIEAQVYVTHYRNLKQIKFDNSKRPPDLTELDNEWLYGESGAGKSSTVRKEHKNFFDKMCNKWWDHYNGEEVILLDDFDKTHECLGHHLKRWADLYAFPIEVKNHVTFIRPKKIIVTSQYTPEEIFKDSEVAKAIRRRFQFRNIIAPPSTDQLKKSLKITNPQKKKVFKHDSPYLKKPALLKQNASGQIVTNNTIQPKIIDLTREDNSTQRSVLQDIKEENSNSYFEDLDPSSSNSSGSESGSMEEEESDESEEDSLYD